MKRKLDRPSLPETLHGRWMSKDYRPGWVSVVTPTHDRGRLLLEAMDSVAAQSYRPIELNVVDDGSREPIGKLVTDWNRKHKSDSLLVARYLRQNHCGACAARNLGLIESQGEFIQYLDSDDMLHPSKLELQVEALETNSDLDFVWSGTSRFETAPDWQAEPYCGTARRNLLPDFITQLVWKTESGLYRRGACVRTGPWNEKLSKWQDWEYNMRFVLLDPAVKHVAGTLSSARNHASGQISNLTFTQEGQRGMLLATEAVERCLRGAGYVNRAMSAGLAWRYRQTAANAILYGNSHIAARAMRRAMRLNPGLFGLLELELFGIVNRIPVSVRSRLVKLGFGVKKLIRQAVKK